MTNSTEAMNYNVLGAVHTPTISVRTPLPRTVKLLKGVNTMAVEVHKDTAAETLVGFDLRLISRTPQGYPSAVPPIIEVQPAGLITNANATISLSALIDGTPIGMVDRWYKNHTNFVGTSPVVAGSPTVLTIPNAQITSSGEYFVVASNAFGSVTSSVAMVAVQQKPTITTAPASGTVAVGTNYLFSVKASGSDPLTYQWYFAGLLIPNRTNAFLVVANTAAPDQGNYTVVVSNLQGSVTSAPAALTISSSVVTPPGLVGPIFGAGTFSLKVVSVTGHTYILQTNPNIENQAGWTDITASTTAGTGGTLTLSDPAPTGARRFYRLKIQ
jgi:hypothetical protein